MALPTRTPEQLQEALEKAKENRRKRAGLLGRIKRGEVRLTDVFWMADQGDEIAAGTKVLAVVRAIPGVSARRAMVFLQDAQVAPSRKVRGTGTRQRATLVHLIGSDT